jgi:hypothetical protein
MKIAFSYKGAFNIDYIKKYGVDEIVLKNVSDTIDNNIEKIFNVLNDLSYRVDTFISTYKIHDKIDGEWLRRVSPVDYYQGEPSYSSPTTIPQLEHFKRLINMIVEEEEKTGEKYDLLIFTRLDIKMLKSYNELNISHNHFNIILQNQGGGCDDNFFVFPRKYFNQFIESVDSLYAKNQIIHNINHELEGRGVIINYMEELNPNIYMGHKAFEFVRCGSDPNDVFSINSNFSR